MNITFGGDTLFKARAFIVTEVFTPSSDPEFVRKCKSNVLYHASFPIYCKMPCARGGQLSSRTCRPFTEEPPGQSGCREPTSWNDFTSHCL